MYSVVRDQNNKLLLDAEGNVLIKDNESNQLLWVEQRYIKYNERNQPIVQLFEEELDENQNIDNTQEVLQEIPLEGCSNQSTSFTWSYDSTLAFIATVESHYDEMYHPKKRKNFWTIISEDLISQNIQVTPLICQRKWNNLVRTYKSCKDTKNKTGRGPTRFLFFDQMNELLGHKPNISSPYSVDVSQILNKDQQYRSNCQNKETHPPEPIPSFEYVETEEPEQGPSKENQDPKKNRCDKKIKIPQKKNLQADYYRSKINYYNTKSETLIRKQVAYEKHLESLREIQQQKNILLERQIKNSEKKTEAMSEMVLLEKQKSSQL